MPDLAQEQGRYDKVAVYRSKKDSEPLCVLQGDAIVTDVVDDCLDNGKKTLATRWYN